MFVYIHHGQKEICCEIAAKTVKARSDDDDDDDSGGGDYKVNVRSSG